MTITFDLKSLLPHIYYILIFAYIIAVYCSFYYVIVVALSIKRIAQILLSIKKFNKTLSQQLYHNYVILTRNFLTIFAKDLLLVQSSYLLYIVYFINFLFFKKKSLNNYNIIII